MRISTLVFPLLGLTSARPERTLKQLNLVASNQDEHDEGFHMPTIRESTAMARKILHLTTIGNLVTVFPEPSSSDTAETLENRPEGMGGSPIGLMEYYADCEPETGNPILLGINIATPFRNYAAGSNISLSVRWWPERKNTYSSMFNIFEDDEIPTPHTPAALPRFSLHGQLKPLTDVKDMDKIAKCFLRAHPDSIYWQPGNDIHSSQYMQLIVEQVYWFGGFGDRSRIGWLPMDTWRNLNMDEIIAAELPGESRKKSSWLRDWL